MGDSSTGCWRKAVVNGPLCVAPLHLVLAMLSIPLATDDHAAPQPQIMPYIATARQCLQSCLTCFADHCLA
jgi:hypothetical protein